MHSSRIHTVRCSGRFSCHACPPQPNYTFPPTTHPPTMHDPLPCTTCLTCPLAIHAPNHACPHNTHPPPHTHTPTTHTPLPCMPPSRTPPCHTGLPCHARPPPHMPPCHTRPPLDRMTDTCENITFP